MTHSHLGGASVDQAELFRPGIVVSDVPQHLPIDQSGSALQKRMLKFSDDEVKGRCLSA